MKPLVPMDARRGGAEPAASAVGGGPEPSSASAAHMEQQPPGIVSQGRRRRWLLAALGVLIAGVALSATSGMLWRASEQRHARLEFQSTASNVSATLGTLIRRDADFVATLRTVLAMRPQLSPSGFQRWYVRLQGGDRQVGGIGSAVIASVPAGQLSAFEARRDRDPSFRALFGKWLTPVQRGHQARYCLVAGGGAIVQLTSLTASLVQEDFCQSSSLVGATQSSMLGAATDTGQLLTLAVNLAWLHTMFLESAFYRMDAPLNTVARRRAAVAGWLVSSFDMPTVIGVAIGHNRGLSVELYHTNPGAAATVVGSGGSAAHGAQLTERTALSIDGSWSVVVRGAPISSGPLPDAQGLLVFIGGALVSILLALLVLTLARGRERALAMVEQKTGQLRHQALHDALTGLPNRVLALDRAEQMLARARRTHVPMAALYVDIDAFKHVNDTFGHAAGDHFLELVAARLRSVLRESDTASRLSGDEFLVLLEGSALDAGPQLVAERLLDVLREPYDMTARFGRQLSVTASIGVAYGQRHSAEELIADADVALYAAKSAGKNRFVMFESEMQTAAQDRMTLELDLGDALDRGELLLVYQPMFDLGSMTTTGLEALLRWRHPTRGIIGPDDFIPIAESTGLILPIGRWVLYEACRRAAAWRADGHELTISVNVSGRQLDHDELVDDVRHALEDAALDPSTLTIEITETTLMRDPDATARRLAALKRLGVRVAIDDFGTGYSSLAYLRQFPIDSLKIDRSFIDSIANSRESTALIHTLVQLGKSLGLETLGEGIEEPNQLRHLQSEHCDRGQGFLFARPLDADGIDEFLRAQPPNTASTG
jgi:diguanylate cyclase (GGDEF)-like protein